MGAWVNLLKVHVVYTDLNLVSKIKLVPIKEVYTDLNLVSKIKLVPIKESTGMQ